MNVVSKYQIFPKYAGKILGRHVEPGIPIACRICGSTEEWKQEGDTAPDGEPRAFVCEHEPIDLGRKSVRQIDSVGTRHLQTWVCVTLGSFEEPPDVWPDEWQDLWNKVEP